MELLRGINPQPKPEQEWWQNIVPGTQDRAPVTLGPEQYDVPANIADPDAMSGFQDFLRNRVPVERI